MKLCFYSHHILPYEIRFYTENKIYYYSVGQNQYNALYYYTEFDLSINVYKGFIS